LQYGGSSHLVIEQSDGTRALLPAWMTEPWAAQLAIVERPRLPLGGDVGAMIEWLAAFGGPQWRLPADMQPADHYRHDPGRGGEG
jgi:hypothetical protein